MKGKHQHYIKYTVLV